MEWIGAAAATAHAGLAIVAAALAIATTGLAAAAALGVRVRRATVDQLITLLIAAAGLALLIGPVLLATRGLRDLLHVLYAIAALVSLPLARVLAVGEVEAGVRREPGTPVDRRLGRWLTLAGLVTLGALLRLAMTG